MEDYRVLTTLVTVYDGRYNDQAKPGDPVARLVKLTAGHWTTEGLLLLMEEASYHELREKMRTSQHHLRWDIGRLLLIHNDNPHILIDGHPMRGCAYHVDFSDGRCGEIEIPTEALHQFTYEGHRGGAERIVNDSHGKTVFQGFDLAGSLHCLAMSDTTQPRFIGIAACMYVMHLLRKRATVG